MLNHRSHTHRAVMACLGLLLAAGCSREPDADYLASGRDFLQRKEYASALIQLRNAAGRAPEHAETRYLLGLALRGTANPVSAEVELRRALELGHAPEQVLPVLCRSLLDTAQYDKVIDLAASRQVGDATTRAELKALWAEALAAKGQPVPARRLYEEALALDPANATARLGTARLMAASDQGAEAAATVDSVLSAHPDSAEAWALRAALLARETRLQEAVAAYEKAVELQPADVRSHLALVPMLLTLNKVDRAAEVQKRLAKLVPSAPGTVYLDALVASAKGEGERARSSIQLALRAAPDDLRIQLLAGSIEYDLGNHEAAKRLLQRVVDAVPAEPRARQLLAASQLRLGEIDLAEKTLAPLLASPNAGGRDFALAAEVAQAAGDSRKALARIEQALARDAANPAWHVALGRLLLASGQAARGVAELEAVVRADPGNTVADALLVEHFLGARQVDRAEAVATAVQQRLPETAVGYNLLGLVRRAQGQRPGARQQFEKALSSTPGFPPAARNLASMDLEDGRADAAEERYRALVAANPRDPQAALLLAGVMRRAGKPAGEVAAVLDRALEGNRGFAPLHLAKVDVLMGAGDRQAALAAATAAQAALPLDARVGYVLARVQQSTGDLGQARASLGRLSGEHPNAIAPHLAMAEIQVMEQQWDAARASVRRALALRPDYLPGHMALVEIGVRAGAFDEALTAARAIQTRWPRSGAGHAAEASVLAARQDPAGAEKVLRAGLAASGDPALAVTLHRQLLARDRGGEADREIEAWLARTPGAPAGVLLAVGDSWQARQDHARAAAWYRRAVEANPKDAVALNNLAWELGRLGNREALDIARRALEQAPRSAPVLDTMGVLSLQFGEPADSVRHLEQAVQQAPQVPGFRVNLARALIRAGRKADAGRQLDEATRLRGDKTPPPEIEELRRQI